MFYYSHILSGLSCHVNDMNVHMKTGEILCEIYVRITEGKRTLPLPRHRCMYNFYYIIPF
jgi:hypothetical protein